MRVQSVSMVVAALVATGAAVLVAEQGRGAGADPQTPATGAAAQTPTRATNGVRLVIGVLVIGVHDP